VLSRPDPYLAYWDHYSHVNAQEPGLHAKRLHTPTIRESLVYAPGELSFVIRIMLPLSGVWLSPRMLLVCFFGALQRVCYLAMLTLSASVSIMPVWLAM